MPKKQESGPLTGVWTDAGDPDRTEEQISDDNRKALESERANRKEDK